MKCAGVVPQLEAAVLDEAKPHKQRMHSLWSLAGGNALSPSFASKLLTNSDASLRSWAVRCIGRMHADNQHLASACATLADDPSADVQLQVAIAAGKLQHIDALQTWVNVLAKCGDDALIPHIVWQNLHPRLPAESERLLQLVEQVDLESAPGLAAMLTKVAEKLQD
ncbi:MAG: hypothetical protein R3C53_07650 [Pirellulaceae bacterium]